VRISYRRTIALIALLVPLAGLAGGSFAEQDGSLRTSLADADMTLVGEDNGDWAAYFASPAGDVNGDGLGDILIGAPMAGNKVCPIRTGPGEPCPGVPKGEGVAYLILGRPRGEGLPSLVNLAQADASFLGCRATSMTARQLYTAGDVNGDGYDDILVSGWKCGVSETGKAYLFLGRPDVGSWGDDFPVERADASFLGENAWDFAGYHASTAGDVDGDGYDDFLVASTQYDISGTQIITNAGKVCLILGRHAADWGRDYPLALADASFLGEAEEDRLGRSAAGVGDVNGDGYDDFLIGSISSDYGGVDAGQSYLFLGRATQDDPRYDPARPWWGQGYSVAGATGSFVGEAAGDESGRRVARAGDVNQDGYGDFLIGAAQNGPAARGAGIAHLILGRRAADWGVHYSLTEADASFTGEEKRDQAGRRLSGAGDVNNDGYDDLLVGAPHNERGGPLAGAAYVIYGRAAADWGRYYSLSGADITFVGKAEVGAAGYDVAWLGDFDGDGIDDYLIAAYGGRNNDDVPGEAYVLLGSDAPVPVQFSSEAPEGDVREWYRFGGDYMDPNGWQDITRAQLIMERRPGDRKGLGVSYEPAGNALYLRGGTDPRWLGPCAPGESVTLSNGIVQLDCRHSSANHNGAGRLQVTWRARWIQPVISTREFNVYLRAVDQSRHDSDLVEFGAWTLWPKAGG
jgi:hypothetical protein